MKKTIINKKNTINPSEMGHGSFGIVTNLPTIGGVSFKIGDLFLRTVNHGQHLTHYVHLESGHTWSGDTQFTGMEVQPVVIEEICMKEI